MKRVLKIGLIICLSILGLILISGGILFYKIKYGFPFYDRTPPAISFSEQPVSILLFSKTNGFRHGDAIESSKKMFDELAEKNNWFLFETENGAVFNSDQLAKFDVVIWNNSTGQVLKEKQRKAFEEFIENGGSFMGIHGAGDFSHPWPWYINTLIGAEFTHHTMSPLTPEATMNLEPCLKDTTVCEGLMTSWKRAEEWYSFSTNPRDQGFTVLYTVDENDFDPSGIGYDGGMGDDHPIVWYKKLPKGKSFYSALGHSGEYFEEHSHIKMLENGINWLLEK